MESKDSKRIALVLLSGESSLSLRFCSAISRLATRSEVALFVFTEGVPPKEQVVAEEFSAVILFADPLLASENIAIDLSLFDHIPSVVVNFTHKESPSLLCDLSEAAAALVQHTLAKARRIAYIQGAVESRLARQSFQAYRDTLANHKIPLDFTLITERGLFELVDDRALVAGQDFDAVYCFSEDDALTFGVQAEQRGITVPVVVGATSGGNTLASVVLPISSMARSAWALALDGEVVQQHFFCEVALLNSLEDRELFSHKPELVSTVIQGYDLDTQDAQTIQEFVEICSSLDESKITPLRALIAKFLKAGGSSLLLARLIAGFAHREEGRGALFFPLLLYGAQLQVMLHKEQHSLFSRIEQEVAKSSSFTSIGEHLSLLGITHWFLVQRHIRSRVVAGSHKGSAQGISFDLGLLPPLLEPLLHRGCWFSIPLGYEAKRGYLLVETSSLLPKQVLLFKALFSKPFVAEKDRCVVAIGAIPSSLAHLLGGFKQEVLQSCEEFFPAIQTRHPALLIIDRVALACINEVRARRATSSTPIILVKDFFSSQEIEDVLFVPRLIIVHTSVAKHPTFLVRLASLAAGEGATTPTMTAVLVKKAIVYIDTNTHIQFSRLDIAEAVNASEDYLGRVFRKEMGLSLWDYLHIHRIARATTLLQTTALSVTEIAHKCGFKDLAYFSRVFKKVMGCAPSHMQG